MKKHNNLVACTCGEFMICPTEAREQPLVKDKKMFLEGLAHVQDYAANIMSAGFTQLQHGLWLIEESIGAERSRGAKDHRYTPTRRKVQFKKEAEENA